MNLIEFTEFLLKSVKYIVSTLIEVIKLINPANIDGVFKNMKVGTVGMLFTYLAIINIPLFLGYYLYLLYFQQHPYATWDAVKVAARYYLIGLLMPLSMAYVLYLFDVRLLKRKVTHAEALTLFAYALSPGILGGAFRVIDQTFILHLLLIMYSIYLVYAGMSARFGEEHITMPFIFLILVGIMVAIAIHMSFTAIAGIPQGYY